MKHYLRGGVLAAFLLGAAAAHADSAKTLGGIVVTSDDGNFVGSLGGRIQFDETTIEPDKGTPFDSGAEENDSGFYFRRVYLSLTGRVYGWRYRIDEDFSNTSNPANGFKYVFISHDFGDFTVRVGQAKPWRSLDEMASDLDTPFVERNATSSYGLYGARQYNDGVFARYSHSNLLLPHDHVWGGVSVYSLNSAGSATNEGTGTPTEGFGYNARLTYEPIVADREWAHVGISYSNEHADNGASLTVADSAWYSYKGVSQTLASLSGSVVNTGSEGTLGNLGGGNSPTASITQGELAGAYGSLYLQSELGLARLSQETAASATTPNVQNVYAFDGEATYFLTGESRGFDLDASTFKRPKPIHDYGAVEVAVGYNYLKNRDIPSGDTTGVCKPSLGAIPAGTHITKCDVTSVTAGVNYYVNNNVQFMLDYYYGVYNAGNAGKNDPKALNARVQIWF